MKSRHGLILLVILMIIVAIVLVFVLPGITRNNDHLKANQFFTEGLACELSKDYACAIDRYQKAIALYGQDSNYFIYLAHVQMSQGDYAESIENYQKAKAIDPSNESILPGINKVISLQATQTALYNPLAMEYTPTTISNSLQEFPTVTSNAEKIPVQPGSLPQAVYTILMRTLSFPRVLYPCPSPKWITYGMK
jgi:tetratricopeptide (TPR) repeat protein